MALYTRIPHSRIKRRQAAGPATVDTQFDRATPIARFNSAFAVAITRVWARCGVLTRLRC